MKAVLFDLDGTLVDSAPDLAATANQMRAVRGLEPLPYPSLRRMVGAGARGMIGTAFGVAPDDPRFDALRTEFLDRYAQGLLTHTQVFPAMQPALARLGAAGMPWGIVTNKAERFTLPLVAGLPLLAAAAAVVAGDTTPHSKPHPEPLYEAARRLGLAPGDCVYVGDDLRDVQAGRAAGMATVVAAWGYLGDGEPVEAWGADRIVEDPAALLNWLGVA
jgi:N-acetyl-D-muramate 6-phosphate phosphatase